jgi:hypothetical protein
MLVAAILGAVILSLGPRFTTLSVVALSHTAPAEQTSQVPNAPSTPAPATPSKPCPATSGADSATPSPDCKPTVHSKTKRKKHKHTPQADASPDGPTKTVVRNGSTTDPTVAISPGLSQQQILQQMQNTDQLLASTDANLKVISSRQLSASQQDTVTQIKSFMEQARVASSNGDVPRAYNLASKANMLSADLKGH